MVRGQIISLLGGKCVKCGFDDQRAIQIDHVYGDGAEERAAVSGTAYYRQILRQIHSGRYQLLCCNCNWIKRLENFEGRRFKLEEYELGIMTNEYEQECSDVD